jgi:GrpB-like predicted nucleotidyltransferase (UPF0157 family)
VSPRILLTDCDPQWPEVFRREARRIRFALGGQALQIEHIGSTSVPCLVAKPVIDILLVVADSSDESTYLPILESVDYLLCIREPEWHEHRMFKGPAADINLHVFSSGCPEINRILAFRDRCAAMRRIVISTNAPNDAWHKWNGRMCRSMPMPKPR